MRDDAMDESIRELAQRAYNPPPEPPRDELWERIQATRRARVAGADAATLTDARLAPVAPAHAEGVTGSSGDAVPGVISLAARRRQAARWALRIVPIAALLALSFGLGRLSWIYQRPLSRPGAPGAAVTPAPSPAMSAPVAAGRVAVPAPSPAVSAPIGVGAPEPTPLAAAPRATNAVAAGVTAGSSRLLARAPAVRGGARASLYGLAAQQTLGQAEMLLTSFRAEARAGGTVDPQVTRWAGDLLSSTRLLLDSPAARDPRLRSLLEDLELVLAQIVQLGATPPDARSGDTDLIDHALQQRDLMLRLRSAVPAGATVGA